MTQLFPFTEGGSGFVLLLTFFIYYNKVNLSLCQLTCKQFNSLHIRFGIRFQDKSCHCYISEFEYFLIGSVVIFLYVSLTAPLTHHHVRSRS